MNNEYSSKISKMIDFMYWIKAYLTESAEGWVASVKSLVLRVILSLIILIILLWIAVFLYGSFYYLYMPTISYTKPVHFNFKPSLSKNCEAQHSKRDTADYMCSFPLANISLVGEGRDQLMVRGQGYRVLVELDMPETPMNQEMGMFVVRMDFYVRGGDVVKSSQRLAMLRYRSVFLQMIETIFFIPLFVSGAAEQKQLLAVELFDNYVEDAFKPAVGIIIELQSYKIQFYSAALKIHAEFTGLRYMMHKWPMLCAFVGISSNMFFLLTIAFFSWFRFLWAKTEGPTLERMDSRRVLFDEALPEEERRRNIQQMLEREEREESRRSSQSSNGSSNPETLQANPVQKSSLEEEAHKSSSEEDTVLVYKRDIEIGPEETELQESLRLRKSTSATL